MTIRTRCQSSIRRIRSCPTKNDPRILLLCIAAARIRAPTYVLIVVINIIMSIRLTNWNDSCTAKSIRIQRCTRMISNRQRTTCLQCPRGKPGLKMHERMVRIA